jgi:hypothetical protein
MSNTKTAQPKVYKFTSFQNEAERSRKDAESRPEVPPFVMEVPGDDAPDIVITAPDTLERMLIIADTIGADGTFELSRTLTVLRALCGEAFPRVWSLVKNDKDPAVLIPLVQAIFRHFESVIAEAQEANADLPGGSGDSSN